MCFGIARQRINSKWSLLSTLNIIKLIWTNEGKKPAVHTSFLKWWTTHSLRNRKNKMRAIFYFRKHIHWQWNVSTSQKQGELCTPWASLAAGGRRHFAVQWATAWSAWRRAWSTSFPPGRIQWCRLLPPAWPPRPVAVAVGFLGTHLSPTSTHTLWVSQCPHTSLVFWMVSLFTNHIYATSVKFYLILAFC